MRWAYLVAKYGLTFVWLVVPACLLQYPLILAVGRYTSSTGESVLRGFHRVHPAVGAVATLLAAGALLPLGAFAASSGTALAALIPLPGGFTSHGRALLWSAAVVAAGAAMLLSRDVYRGLERCALAGVLVTGLALLWACAQPEVRTALPTFGVALAGPPGPSERGWDVHDSAALVAAVTLFGLGGFWIPIYSAWVRASGNATAVADGHLVDDAPTSAAAWGRRRRCLGVATLVASAGSLLATLLVCLVAYALLYPRGVVPQGDVTSVLRASYDLPWGAAGRAVLLVVAAALSLGAWLAAVDGSSRLYAELIADRGSGACSRDERRTYLATVAIACVITCLVLALGGGEVLGQLGTATSFVAAVLFPAALFVLDHRRLAPALPAGARPPRGEALALAASGTLHALLAAAYAWASWPWW